MKRLGCLTTSGLLAGLITAMVIAGVAIAQGGVLFNPGPLNAQEGPMIGGVTSHAAIGGECKACHVAPWEKETMDVRCLNCHQAVAVEKANPQTLHGSIYQRNPQLSCRECHTEHQGSQASLTRTDLQGFPHETVGFSLATHQQKQDGQPFACRDCHTQGLQTFDAASCEECHRRMDAAFLGRHVQEFGGRCLACHDGTDRFGKAFVHPASFPLEGKHASLACGDCHAGARQAADFKIASSASPISCVSCHQKDDAHQGRFGSDCATCHTPNAWKPANFDHNATRFPLTGAHLGIACSNCHQSLTFKGTPTECVACHRKDEPHQGRFGTNCALCHSTAAWKPATFDHNLTNFPLTGAHARIACENCHGGGNFTALPTSCVACHGEPAWHAGAFGQNCAACHSTNAWRPAKFNLAHPEPRVEEHGSGIYHGNTSCRTCHPSTVRTYTCLACHSNNKGGEGGEGGGEDDDDD